MWSIKHFLTILLFIAVMTPLSAFAQVIGDVIFVEGGVTISNAKKPTPVALKTREKISMGDHIVTTEFGFVEMAFRDGSKMVISENSDVTITKFNYNPISRKKEALIDMKQGFTNHMVSKLVTSDSSYQVRTPNAVAGVRGTNFSSSYDPQTQQTETSVTEGQVVQDGRGNSSGSPQTVNSGQTCTVQGDSKASEPTTTTNSQQQQNSSRGRAQSRRTADETTDDSKTDDAATDANAT